MYAYPQQPQQRPSPIAQALTQPVAPQGYPVQRRRSPYPMLAAPGMPMKAPLASPFPPLPPSTLHGTGLSGTREYRSGISRKPGGEVITY